VCLLHFEQSFLRVETGVESECTRYDEEGVGERDDTKLDFTRHLGSGVLDQVLVGSDFESTASWNDAFVLHGVLDCAKSISDGLLGLSNLVVVWTLDQDGAGEGVLDTLDEGVFIVTEDLLVDVLGVTEVSLGEIFDGVHLVTATSEWDSLTISLLASSDTNDAVSGEDLE
jgi:hypothetical protein